MPQGIDGSVGDDEAAPAATEAPSQRERYGERGGRGCLLYMVVVLVLAAGFLLGGPVGALLIGALVCVPIWFLGESTTTKWRCGSCKNPIASGEVTLCPTCKAELDGVVDAAGRGLIPLLASALGPLGTELGRKVGKLRRRSRHADGEQDAGRSTIGASLVRVAPWVLVPCALLGVVPLVVRVSRRGERAADDAYALAGVIAKVRADGLPRYCPTGDALRAESGGLLKGAAPEDPWGIPFVVTCTGSLIAVTSAGPDGKIDSADDIRRTTMDVGSPTQRTALVTETSPTLHPAPMPSPEPRLAEPVTSEIGRPSQSCVLTAAEAGSLSVFVWKTVENLRAALRLFGELDEPQNNPAVTNDTTSGARQNQQVAALVYTGATMVDVGSQFNILEAGPGWVRVQGQGAQADVSGYVDPRECSTRR